MVLVGMPSTGSGTGGSGVGALLEPPPPPPQAVKEAAKNTLSTILFNDVFKFVPTLASVYKTTVHNIGKGKLLRRYWQWSFIE